LKGHEYGSVLLEELENQWVRQLRVVPRLPQANSGETLKAVSYPAYWTISHILHIGILRDTEATA
jgi:hypothetical protein